MGLHICVGVAGGGMWGLERPLHAGYGVVDGVSQRDSADRDSGGCSAIARRHHRDR